MSESESEEIEEEEELEEEVIDPEEKKVANEIRVKRIEGSNRRTSNILSLMEFVAAVTHRAYQIQNGAPFFVESPGICQDVVIKIAQAEIFQKKCPLSILRTVEETDDSKTVEVFPINEMELLPKCIENISELAEVKSSVLSFEETLKKI